MLFCRQQLGEITYVDHIVARLHRSNLTSRRTKARLAIDRSPVARHGKLLTDRVSHLPLFLKPFWLDPCCWVLCV